jgi:iron(III) transport system substrate-binding protein
MSTIRPRRPREVAALRGRRRALVLLASAALGPVIRPAAAQEIIRFAAKGRVPAGYPAQYAALIDAAEQEGKLVIHSTTDLGIVAPVIDDFQTLYPRIEVLYYDMNSTDLYNGYLDDLLTSPTTADVLWSSAMDLQLRAAAAGQAQPYDSPERTALPAWAAWKDVAFGTTYEPIAIAYNKRLLAADEVPKTHADLARLLTERRDRFAGKVVTYNIERSGLGFMLAVQDDKASGDYWSLAKALGDAGARVVPTTEAMLTGITGGTDLVAYNALGTYASAQAKRNASLAYVYPQDYTLVITRVMLIGKKAANSNAARLWVDYLLSKRGQTALGDRAGLYPLRADAQGAESTALTRSLGGSARPLSLDPSLANPFPDAGKRAAFLRQWQQAVARP